ncbi:MAG: hypothetical protein E7290_13795 [Lachnospiraceae bacterium]|nr:hypothetical protein [Lachnospiraceae bacterium]
MKKFLSTLLMLTCVLSLTACGSEGTVDSHQEKKNDTAAMMAEAVVDTTLLLVEQWDVDEQLANYSTMEIKSLYEYNYYNYVGVAVEIEPKAAYSALSSFDEGVATLGDNIEVGEPVAEAKDDEIIVLVPIKGDSASGEVELIFSNDIFFKVSSCTLNIGETFGELMAHAALNTIIGVSTVFLVLILISFIIAMFGFIPKLQEKFTKKEEPVAAPVETAPVVEEEELADDMELVAVIAAAIAAYEGTCTDGFQVRSIKRANTSKWKRA